VTGGNDGMPPPPVALLLVIAGLTWQHLTEREEKERERGRPVADEQGKR